MSPLIIFITGGGNGLGLETTRHMLALGHKVIAADINIDKIQEVFV